MKYSIIVFLKQSTSSKKPVKVKLVTVAKETIFFNVGFSLLLKNFDKEKKRVFNHPLADQYNMLILKTVRSIELIYLNLKNTHESEPNKEQLKIAFAKHWNLPTGEEKKTEVDLPTYIEDHFIPSRREYVTEKRVSAYANVLRHLQNYAKKKKQNLTFDKIDRGFFHSFLDYLYTLRVNKQKFSDSHTESVFKIIRAFMNGATDDGYNKNLEYKNFKFTSSMAQEGTGIYLNKNELETIYLLDLSHDPKLEHSRDWFILAAYTGIRYSDYHQVVRKNIILDSKGNEYLNIFTVKTGAEITVPLTHPYVKAILKKHAYVMPKIISNQKMNQYLKEIGEFAQIDLPVTNITKRGGRKIRTTKPKFKHITTHTARRSFATNAYLSGEMSAPELIKMTGHSDMRMLLRYIRISKTEAAYKAAKNSFFNPDNNK